MACLSHAVGSMASKVFLLNTAGWSSVVEDGRADSFLFFFFFFWGFSGKFLWLIKRNGAAARDASRWAPFLVAQRYLCYDARAVAEVLVGGFFVGFVDWDGASSVDIFCFESAAQFGFFVSKSGSYGYSHTERWIAAMCVHVS